MRLVTGWLWSDRNLVMTCDDTIAKVVLTGNPWQELKWHANQLRPPLTLIKHSELQKTTDQRADRPVGAKKHKQAKGKGKGKHALSAVLDPTMLRLEGGVFQRPQGQALAQVALTGLAVGVSGVVHPSCCQTIFASWKGFVHRGPGISFVGWFSFGSVWFRSCCACPFGLRGNLRATVGWCVFGADGCNHGWACSCDGWVFGAVGSCLCCQGNGLTRSDGVQLARSRGAPFTSHLRPCPSFAGVSRPWMSWGTVPHWRSCCWSLE